MPLSDYTKADKNELSSDSIFLICLEIFIPITFDNETIEYETINIVKDNKDLEWQNDPTKFTAKESKTWIAIDFEIGSISETSKGEIPKLDVSISNTNRVMESYLQQYDLFTKLFGYYPITVDIMVVNTGNVEYDEVLGYRIKPTAEISYRFELKQPQSTDKIVTFTLGASNPYTRRVPLNRMLKNQGKVKKFKDWECGYVSPAIYNYPEYLSFVTTSYVTKGQRDVGINRVANQPAVPTYFLTTQPSGCGDQHIHIDSSLSIAPIDINAARIYAKDYQSSSTSGMNLYSDAPVGITYMYFDNWYPDVQAGSIFQISGSDINYVVLTTDQQALFSITFAPPLQGTYLAGTPVYFGMSIPVGISYILNITEAINGSTINLSTAIPNLCLTGSTVELDIFGANQATIPMNTMFTESFNNTQHYVISQHVSGDNITFSPPAASDWPIGTEIVFDPSVPISIEVISVCNKSFLECLGFGNEKRYCGFPTTGGRSIVI